jgi:hypothetical protein
VAALHYDAAMCCFSAPVLSVSGTNIFARAAQDGRQYLAYSMTVLAPSELAMILPLPVASGGGEDAVRFIDLSGYPDLFSDLVKGFPEPVAAGRGPASRGVDRTASLAVVQVGSFEASYSPGVADLDRLDARFRLPTDVWARLGDYASFGFAVFRLKAGESRVHPMAFSFPRADPTKLFFPTVHVHDGAVHETAGFDHALYCQRAEHPETGRPSSVAPDRTWTRSTDPVRVFARPGRAHGILDGDQHCLRRRIVGRAPNRDV